MPINFNTHILQSWPAEWPPFQRGLFYADALFETVRVFDGRIPLLHHHTDRLFNGLRALSFQLPADWSTAFFENQIQKVAPPNARVRLTVWRSPGGLYRPENNDPQFLITAEPMPSAVFEWLPADLILGICRSVRLPVDEFSNFKTLNAARYGAAAREAQERGWDDALILNSFNRICEASSSNVFWWEGPALFTPPLSEGCVAGIMRKLVLQLAAAQNLDIQEKPAEPDDLHGAGEIFLTNAVRGIVPVQTFAGRQLENERTQRLFSVLSPFTLF